MGLLVDIRKYNIDNIINDLVDASKIKKNWLGKVTDKYWDYLEQTTTDLKTDLNAHLIADLFVYFVDNLKFKEVLNNYSKALSDNRNAFVIILLADDIELILEKLNNSNFISDFERFCKDLNGAYYDYNVDMLTKNISDLKSTFDQVDDNNGLIINVG
ncbi:MAG: hypothetical protein IM613_05620 [Cytophagales bacterium]|jgi:hypothetical protein|nr:hypothetical protein [Cytophagales bacterium]MCA6387966.1 hypothetical protein [Cytophagales bacterium]MCA6393028.1 hypothetical protein [Cytophagales bacterium]MCA6428897.1 hypothetical protein [Cytophagales bacterium]